MTSTQKRDGRLQLRPKLIAIADLLWDWLEGKMSRPIVGLQCLIVI